MVEAHPVVEAPMEFSYIRELYMQEETQYVAKKIVPGVKRDSRSTLTDNKI
jgi:hypothetical protein